MLNGDMEEDLDNLAFRFFKLFAQYESTLKERDFFRVNGGRIVVDWNRFATHVVGTTFKKDLNDLRLSADYILQNPPMKQAVNADGKIIWEPVSNVDQSVQALFGHICRTRNNLFHGAKFNGTWFSPERSEALIQHSLAILEHYSPWLSINDI